MTRDFYIFFLFQIDADFLQCDDFLVGDITVGTKRHIMFATEDQLTLLQSAKRWYMDGTFKVVQKPFTQLFSIHAFIQKDEMKQVPRRAYVQKTEERLQSSNQIITHLKLLARNVNSVCS